MLRRFFRSFTLVAALVAATCGSVAVASPASADYKFPAGVLSPQFISGTCIYRIWYGNYGNTPFAKFRAYGGSCGNVAVGVYAADSNGRRYFSNGTWTGGRDSCGTYFEKQATGRGPAIATGERLHFPVSRRTYIFWNDRGDPVRPYRYC